MVLIVMKMAVVLVGGSDDNDIYDYGYDDNDSAGDNNDYRC